ncbi:hypothetical protein B9Z55_017526 [Caenorhabditis nigoni]|uniref:Uncharacterized protein n=1 Tax=Caenorhabditis nigoni TaxID=1611254 RepID=A0A2G5TAE6_9PELO|nr:hypothetical protein B9Z55_017526 [Caenorhabditis nigoni]
MQAKQVIRSPAVPEDPKDTCKSIRVRSRMVCTSNQEAPRQQRNESEMDSQSWDGRIVIEAVRNQDAKLRHQKKAMKLPDQISCLRIGSHDVSIKKHHEVEAEMISGNRRTLRKLRRNSKEGGLSEERRWMFGERLK